MPLLRRVISLVVVIVLAALVALEAGVWTRTQVEHGPFAREAGTATIFVPVEGPRWGRCCLAARSDSNDTPRQSELRIWVNGTAYSEPHSDHAAIASGRVGLYSHWSDNVRLALPASQPDDETLSVNLVYPLQIRSRTFSLALIAALALALLILVGRLLRNGMFPIIGTYRPGLDTSERQDRALLAHGGLRALVRVCAAYIPQCVSLAAIACVGATTVLSGIYLALTIIAWAQGWALPTTDAILQSTTFRSLAMAEPHGPEFVLDLAVAGTLTAWTARLCGIDQSTGERRLSYVLGLAGPVILVCLLVFSASAQWAGLWRQGDFSAVSIGGLVPFSDANNYYHDASQVMNSGFFGILGSRRPVAQTLRTLLLAASGFNYMTMVLLQCLAVGIAIFFAARSVARWCGPWAGLAFAALTYVVAREFVTTTLTEPLGLIWGLCAVPPLIRGLRERSAGHALLATGLLDIALFTRMGSMFSLLALPIWIVLCFGRSKMAKVRLAGASLLILVGVGGLDFVEAKLYTQSVEMTGSNFSYTICGLTIGGTWSDCKDRYQNELTLSQQKEIGAVEKLMYRKALENFENHPSILFDRLADAGRSFVVDFPNIVTQGYLPVTFIFPIGISIFEVVVAIGLVMRRSRMQSQELWFWLLFGASVIVSASFVFFDDGRRVMIAVYPICVSLLVSGLSTKVARHDVAAGQSSVTAIRPLAGAFVIAAALFAGLAVPYLLHTVLRSSIYSLPSLVNLKSRERVPSTLYVAGSAQMTGLLVVADGAPLPVQVPSMHLSDFTNIVRHSGIEIYQSLVTPDAPPVPFAFVTGPDLIHGEEAQFQLVAPAAVLLRRDVQAWRFDTTQFPKTTPYGPYWLKVTDAVPVPQ